MGTFRYKLAVALSHSQGEEGDGSLSPHPSPLARRVSRSNHSRAQFSPRIPPPSQPLLSYSGKQARKQLRNARREERNKLDAAAKKTEEEEDQGDVQMKG